MVRCDTWEVRSNYLFAPGNSTAMSSERFAFLHNQNDKKYSQLSLFIICRHMSSTNSAQHIFHRFTVHFNSLNFIYQLMHFYIQ